MKKPPKELIPVPWINPVALRFLTSIITGESLVLEIGSGGSTLWFAQYCDYVVSYETDEEWADGVAMGLAKNKLHNADVILYDGIVPSVIDDEYDIVFIDGPNEHRSICIYATLPLLKPGGWMVLDNATSVLYGAVMSVLEERCSMTARMGHKWGETGKYYYTGFWRI